MTSKIDTNQAFYLQSNVGGTVLPDFAGGTLRDNVNGATDNNAYSVENFSTNKIDEFGNTVTFTGTFSGAGPLTFTDSVGGGNAIFTGTSILGGAVTIDSGATLQWGNGTGGAFLLGSGDAVTDNGALVMDFGGASGVVGAVPISGTGTLEVKSGLFEELAAATYTGTTTVDAAGTLTLGNGGSSVGTLAGNIVDNGLVKFDYASAGPVTAVNSFSGSGSAEMVSGTTVITGDSEIGGTVTIDSGATMQWGDGGPAYLVGGGNAVVDNGSLLMDFGGGGIAGAVPISGSGSVTLFAGSLTDAGVSTYTGSTTIDAGGFLDLTGGGSIANSSVIADNGTFDISGTTAGTSITTLTDSGSVRLGAKTLTLTNASGIFSGVLADGGLSGGTGGGLTVASGIEDLTGTNTYTGNTTINLGAVLLLGDLGTTGTVAGGIVDNGLVRFDYGGPVVVSNTFSGSGSAEIATGTTIVTAGSAIGGTVTIDAGATMQWGNGNPGFLVGAGNAITDRGALVMNFGGGGIAGSAPISGPGSVTIQSGSLSDTGVSTYAGATTIDASGFLNLSGSGSISNSSVVNDAGILDISGTAGTSITNLIGSGDVSLGGQTLTLTNASGTFSGVLADGGISGGTGGSLTIASGTETLTGTNTFTGTTTVDTGAILRLGAGGATGTVAGPIALAVDAVLQIVHSAGTSETVNLSLGGDDIVTGGAGNETFDVGATLTSFNHIDGGAGSDTVVLNGDYASGLTFTDATMINVERLNLSAGFNYNLTTNDATVASGQTLTVDASTLGASNTLTFNGAAETNGGFVITGGAGNDTITGGSSGDSINITKGGIDTVSAGGSNDLIYAGAALTAADTIDGGAGTDIVNLAGNYTGGNALTFNATTMVNVERLILGAGFNYSLTTNDATVASGQTLLVDASALGASNTLTFNGSAETNGAFNIIGGAGGNTLTGGTGNDTITGGASGDAIHIENGGNDTVSAGGGNDLIYGGAALTSADKIDGGAGTDIAYLTGNYTGGNALTFNATTMVNVERLILGAGFNYSLTTNDATVASGQTLIVNASALGASNTLTFNGSAETNGAFNITGGAGANILTGGAGNDTITGGASADAIHIENGGNDTVSAGGGNDLIYTGAALTAADKIDGGAGTDIAYLDGNYTGATALTFNATTMVNVERLILSAGHNYSLTTNDATVASGQTMIVNASALGASNSLTFNGSAETNGHFQIFSGLGADHLTGGALSDTFVYSSAAQSTSTGYDTVTGFNFAADRFDLPGTVTAVTGTSHTLSTASFDSDLAAAVSGHFTSGVHDALLVTANAGTLNGQIFLVVDLDGNGVYSAGHDLVIHLASPIGTMTSGDFI